MRRTGTPALLALVEQAWIEQAFKDFRDGADVVYFGTDSTRVGPARKISPSYVYFKPNGRNEATARARFVALSEETVVGKHVSGNGDRQWRFYYGFTDLVQLKSPVAIESMRYYSTNNTLRNDVASSCLIVAPEQRMSVATTAP